MINDYLANKNGKMIISPEGLVIYVQPNKDYIRVTDFYLNPEDANSSSFINLIAQVIDKAKQKNCLYVESQIEIEWKHRAAYFLYYDFKVLEETSRYVYFRKDL